VTSDLALARDIVAAACRLTGTLTLRSGQAASSYPGTDLDAVRHP
jgi:hypothetical protein